MFAGVLNLRSASRGRTGRGIFGFTLGICGGGGAGAGPVGGERRPRKSAVARKCPCFVLRAPGQAELSPVVFGRYSLCSWVMAVLRDLLFNTGTGLAQFVGGGDNFRQEGSNCDCHPGSHNF